MRHLKGTYIKASSNPLDELIPILSRISLWEANQGPRLS